MPRQNPLAGPAFSARYWPRTGRHCATPGVGCSTQVPDPADRGRRSRAGAGLGRDAHTRRPFPGAAASQVLLAHLARDQLRPDGLVAAGCAFWATLALFPAISMLISLSGLMFDPATVEPQLRVLRGLMPPAAFDLIAERVHTLVSHGPASLGLSLLIGTVLALWSASTGTKSMLSALNLAYEEVEKRGFLRFQAIGLLMTLGAIVGADAGARAPGAAARRHRFRRAGRPRGRPVQTRLVRRAGGFRAAGAVRALPLRAVAANRRAGTGSPRVRLVATLLWLAASAVFSFYVGHVADYDATYGPLAAVVGVMMWFWMSAYAVLLGAELNAELEMQTAEDTTTGEPKPIGSRGAFVADNVADE